MQTYKFIIEFGMGGIGPVNWLECKYLNGKRKGKNTNQMDDPLFCFCFVLRQKKGLFKEISRNKVEKFTPYKSVMAIGIGGIEPVS